MLVLAVLIVSPYIVDLIKTASGEHAMRSSCKFGAWSIRAEPTCTDEGERVRYCSCGYIEREKLPTAAHSLDLWVQGEDGIEIFCAVCNIFVAEKKPSEGLAYLLIDDGKAYAVSGSNECLDEEIVIPLTHNGLPVTRIDSLSPNGEYNWWKEDYIYEESFVKRIYVSPNIKKVGSLIACDNLEYLYLSGSVTEVSFSTIKQIEYLRNITIDISSLNGSYKSLDGTIYTADGKALIRYPSSKTDTCFDIPSGVETVEEYAFYGCDALVEVSIPSSVTAVGGAAFSHCSSLKTVKVGNGVIDLSISAFWNCPSLFSIEVDPDNPSYASVDGNLYDKSITRIIQYASGREEQEFTLPKSVKIVGRNSFSGAINLFSVVLPEGVTTIEAIAFNNCEALKRIYLPSTLELINSNAFGGSTAIERVYAPSLKDWCEIKYEYSSYYASPLCAGGKLYLGGYLFEKYIWNAEEYFEMPRGAFRGCGSLTYLSIMGEINKISQDAFYHCDNLETVHIGLGIRSIGNSAFRYCSSLVEINIDPNVYYIDDAAFANCTSLEAFLLPQKLSKISRDLFSGCTNLKRVVIPAGITKIEYRAFWGCTSLSEIQFLGTVEQWLAIEKGREFDYNTGEYTVYCTNGIITKENAN